MPVRETHHIIASLQQGNGGRRQLFVHQTALATLREMGRQPRHRPVFGTLGGSLFECPATAVSYLAIDSVGDEAELRGDVPSAAFRSALEASLGSTTAGIMGWFYLVPMDEAMPRGFGENVAAAATPLLRPWQTILVMTAGPRSDGAFLLWDAVASHVFRSPFYEVLDERAMRPNAPKPTQMVWPSYATGDLVAAVPLSGGDRREVPRREVAHREVPRPEVPRPEVPRREVPPPDAASPPSQTSEDRTFWRGRGVAARLRTSERAEEAAPAPSQSSPPTDRPPKREAADIAPKQRPSASQPQPNVDYADTAEDNSIERYIAIARRDGFNVAAKFDVEALPNESEKQWVIKEPYAGLLLTVTDNDARVLEESLHYNIHVTDPEALQSAFSEHRNDEAQVIYVRESAINELRARSERARSTGELQREWKVTPTIYFVTPSEWDAAASDDTTGPARAIDALNRRRIAAIPDSVTSRLGLRRPAEE